MHKLTFFSLFFKKAMDKDGDGSISKEEFKKVCKSLTKEQVTAAFNKFDKEGTGKFVKELRTVQDTLSVLRFFVHSVFCHFSSQKSCIANFSVKSQSSLLDFCHLTISSKYY